MRAVNDYHHYAVHEGSQLVPVYELDDDEKLLVVLIARAKEQWATLTQKKHKDGLEPTEIGKLAELNAVLDQLDIECKHRVFNDESGFSYSIRSCMVCGKAMVLI